MSDGQASPDQRRFGTFPRDGVWAATVEPEHPLPPCRPRFDPCWRHHFPGRRIRERTALFRGEHRACAVGPGKNGPVDWGLIAAGFVATRTQALLGRYWEHHAPISCPPLTINEMRALIQVEMPGAAFKRRMAHRYSTVWSRPVTPGGATTPSQPLHRRRAVRRSRPLQPFDPDVGV